jgi:hypothetical protein
MRKYLRRWVYCGAVGLAIGLLYAFESLKWYCHALSLALAFAIGFGWIPTAINSPVSELITGLLIVFLLFWGLGGLVLSTLPHHTG